MRKLRQHFSRFWLVYLLVLALITILLRTLVPKPHPLNIEVTSDSIFNLQPGQVLSDQEKNNLNILKETKYRDQTILDVRSDFESKPNQVVLNEAGEVVFVKEQLKYDPNHTLQQYTNRLGEPDLILETPAISSALQAYVFLDDGLVIIAHKKDLSVEQRWSFKPTIEPVFMASWGKEMQPEGHAPNQDPLP